MLSFMDSQKKKKKWRIKVYFCLGIGFWVGWGRTLTHSRIFFKALSSTYTYSGMSVFPDSKCGGGSLSCWNLICWWWIWLFLSSSLRVARWSVSSFAYGCPFLFEANYFCWVFGFYFIFTTGINSIEPTNQVQR